jgi:hypothetical protein
VLCSAVPLGRSMLVTLPLRARSHVELLTHFGARCIWPSYTVTAVVRLLLAVASCASGDVLRLAASLRAGQARGGGDA